ncbi:MAG: 2-oxoacid:acceptor oxidoreductase subunit alpha, partial [Terriglobia bacterium]
MSTTSVQRGLRATDIEDSPAGINNFVIVAATVNGSGSQTANNCLLRALFKMGIPVTGKNLFPSNIQGLPTWFQIRLSEDGFVGRRDTCEVLVALNRGTAAEDIANVSSGGVVIAPSEWKLSEDRTDITYYTLPVQQMAKDSGASADLRPYVANMAYVGALTELLGIDVDEIEAALMNHFGGKRKAVDLNFGVVKVAIEYTRANITKRDPFKVQRSNKTAGKILVNGNSSGAMGAVFGGCSVVAWYPITPSTSLVDALTEYSKKLRADKTSGERNFAIVQAEDELAAIGMALGAGWAGARSMTSTSGPGISLMAEFVGLGYYAEIPAVIFDVQRVGPSTGLPTRTAQGDLLSTAFLSHGDTKHMMLIPASVEECYEMAIEAFDLAEQFQTPVFVMMDLDLGMNNWMSDGFKYPETPINRGKLLTKEKLAELGAKWGRYADVDGDGIPYRTVPGDGLPSYFTRGSGHNDKGQYSERPDDYVENMDRLLRKFNTARKFVPKPAVENNPKAKIGLIAYGTSQFATE